MLRRHLWMAPNTGNYSNLSVVGSCERNISKIHIIFTSPMSAPSLINLFTVSSCNIHKRFDHWQSTAVCCYPPGWGWWPAWGECCHWPRHTGPGHTSSPAAAAHQNMRTSSSIELQTNVHEDITITEKVPTYGYDLCAGVPISCLMSTYPVSVIIMS